MLPTLWGYSEAHAINDAGLVVGFSMVEGSIERPVLWRAGTIVDLGTLGGTSGRANDINACGKVVGSAGTGAGTGQAFLWADGVMTPLPSPGSHSGALAINTQGVMVGVYLDAESRSHAVRWDDGVLSELPTLGGLESEVFDISSSGDIVGWASLADGNRHAALWRNGSVIDLGTLGGESFAHAINAAGVVVGFSDLPSGDFSAFRLPRLPGSTYARAFGVNARGDVVGCSIIQDMQGARPVIWSRR